MDYVGKLFCNLTVTYITLENGKCVRKNHFLIINFFGIYRKYNKIE